jgi:S1-C subfamily serine protease
MGDQLTKQSQQIAELLALNANAQQMAEDKQKQLQEELQKVLAQKDEEAKQKEAAIRVEINEEKKKVAELQALGEKIKTSSKSTQAANQQLAAVGEGSAVLIFCRYSFGEITNDAVGTGFFVSSDGRGVTAKQVIEPWKFDPATAYYMKVNGINANQVKKEIYLWKKDSKVSQAGQPNFNSALSTSAGSLSLLKVAGDDMENQSFQPEDGSTKTTVRVHRTAGENNVALLQIKGSGPAVRLVSANPEKGAAVASFGYPIGVDQPVAKPEIFRAALTAASNHLRLDKATAPGFLGAPLFNANGGVIGMIINQDYVVPVSAITKWIR